MVLQQEGIDVKSDELKGDRLGTLLEQYDTLHSALGVFMWVVVGYLLVWHGVGIAVLYGTLSWKPRHPEMVARGYSELAVSSFTTVSAFSNVGFTLTSDNAAYLKDNPAAYCWITVLIVVGNTGAPLLLRALLVVLLRASRCLRLPRLTRDVQFILNNPRRISTQLFAQNDTLFLTGVLVVINVVQYALFLVSTLPDSRATSLYSKAQLAGIGYFTTICTRFGGFQILDFRLLNRGMLAVYCVLMYLSSAPFVATLNMKRSRCVDGWPLGCTFGALFTDGCSLYPCSVLTACVHEGRRWRRPLNSSTHRGGYVT
jgi:Trk-type K+ transport system membrane component